MRGPQEDSVGSGSRSRRNNRSGRSRSNGNAGKSGQNGRRKGVHKDNEGIVPVLAQVVREVESAVQRRSARPDVRSKFQVVALLARVERHRVLDVRPRRGATRRAAQALDGIATILAKTATRDSRLFGLLAEDAEVSAGARELKHELMPAVASTRRRRGGGRGRDPRRRRYREARGPASGDAASARQPFPHARLRTSRASVYARRLSAGSCSARCSAPSSSAGSSSLHAAAGAALLRPRPHRRPRHPRAHASPGRDGRLGGRGPPDLPAGRRAGPRQARAGAARRRRPPTPPAARRVPQRGQDQLGPRDQRGPRAGAATVDPR